MAIETFFQFLNFFPCLVIYLKTSKLV